MILIIDGYNILKQCSEHLLVTDSEREQFIRLLARYAALKKHEIIVVFDGGDYDRPTSFAGKGIRIMYSGQYVTADQTIQQLIDGRPQNTALITSDRALRLYAEHRGVISLVSDEFYQFIKRELNPAYPEKKKQSLRKITQNSSAELDKLMQEFSSDADIKLEDQREVSLTKKRTLSKHEKKIHKVIKKL